MKFILLFQIYILYLVHIPVGIKCAFNSLGTHNHCYVTYVSFILIRKLVQSHFYKVL